MRALDSSTYFSWENVACNYVDIYNNALPGLYVNDR
jgi:hypothetical protein